MGLYRVTVSWRRRCSGFGRRLAENVKKGMSVEELPASSRMVSQEERTSRPCTGLLGFTNRGVPARATLVQVVRREMW